MNKTLLIAIALAAGLLGACATSSFELRDANEALNSYYAALQQSSDRGDWEMAEQSRFALDTLAQDAAAQGDKQGDARNRIAFYRVATTAAWQSGSNDVMTYAGKGQALCDADNNADRAPRDCAMLKVMPTFASVDQTTEKLDRLTAQLESISDAEGRRRLSPEAEQIFTDYRDSLARLLAARPGIATSPVHPDFVQALDDNLADLLCNKLENQGVGVVAMARGDVAQATCAVWQQKKAALQSGLRAGECLPESGDVADLITPEGC